MACFKCALMISLVSGVMGFSHLHCIRECVFWCGGGVVEGMLSADWGMKEFMGFKLEKLSPTLSDFSRTRCPLLVVNLV